MSQGRRSKIGFFEDFLGPIDAGTEITVADNATNYNFHNVSISANGGEMGLTSTVDEDGGVLSIQTAGGDNEGPLLFSSPVRPANGDISFEVRFKTNDMSLTYGFAGFQETADTDDYDSTFPFTLVGTTFTANNVGQVVGAYFDPDANVDDWRAVAASDGSLATEITSPGVRANAVSGVATLDDEWQIIRVVLYQDGRSQVWVGNNDNDSAGTGLQLVDSFSSAALDPTAVYYPVLWLAERSGAARIFEYDYFDLDASRDWTV